MIVTVIFTGLRWGDVRELKWVEIDLENSIINLEDSKNDELVYPLPVQIKREITELLKNGSPYIFVNSETGKPWRDLRKAFRKAKEKAGITRPFRVHDQNKGFDPMTYAQKRYLFRLLSDRGIEGDAAYKHLKDHFGVDSLSKINKFDASRTIGQMVNG